MVTWMPIKSTLTVPLVPEKSPSIPANHPLRRGEWPTLESGRQAMQGCAWAPQFAVRADGRGGQGFPRPIRGAGHDLGKFGSAPSLVEYLQMLMPFDDPAKISDEDKLAVAAFMPMRNGTLKPNEPLAAATAAATPIR